ncbi:hypothetical protein [Nitrosomonas communis]|uniref:hypothetical protein n=1 Tax=Nitrosomonas communis TaxID=44574 RepID=UPI0026EFFF57|nr:hypothetical protein [Nitrosomonas communis]MCO6426855.1 hypothetical protein [Nitrosomonas communis]
MDCQLSFGQLQKRCFITNKVHIFIDHGILFKLIEQIGTSNILTLLRRPEVSAIYCKEMLYTAKHSIGISPYYNCVAGFLAGDQNAGIIGARTHFSL